MPMREECKHFQSRTYASGETARFCVLDLAPEAPWRCPVDCKSYTRRVADVGWAHGKLVEPVLEDEPADLGGDIAALLDAAESIVNSIGPEAVREAERERAIQSRQEARASTKTSWWRRLRGRSRRRR